MQVEESELFHVVSEAYGKVKQGLPLALSLCHFNTKCRLLSVRD